MERKLAAILSADVQGYSRLMGEDEEATIRTLTTYREVMTALIQQHHGRVVDSPGDNLLAEFASAVDAVQAAVAIQQELKTRNMELPPHRQMHYRIGLNVGDVVVEGERIYGDGVNIAARLESLTDGGGICLSEAVHMQVENKLNLSFWYQGEQTVKNIAKPVRVYRVEWEGTESQEAKGQNTEQALGGRLKGHSGFPSPTRYDSHERFGLSATRSVRPAHRWIVTSVLLIAATLITVQYFSLPTGTQSLAPNPQIAPTALPLPDKPSIVVLPFVNMSGDPSQDYFSDGLTESLTTDLSQLSGLFVIARNSAFTYKGKAVNVQEVSKELGVRYVLEGSVQKANTRVRINVQLVDATSGIHVWAERYDQELQDIFSLQDEIGQKIVFALKVTLTPEEQALFQRFRTDNLEAYDTFLRAWGKYQHSTKEANEQTRQLLEKAITLDPKYAGAYALLGWTYFQEWALQWSENPQSLERAFALAQQAIALDDSLGLAHNLLGYGYLWKKHYEQAVAQAERALALAPNDADVYSNLGDILSWAGRPQEAVVLIEKAIRLNPHCPVWYRWNLGHAYYLLGQYENAITALRQTLTNNADFLPTYAYLAIIYSALGREEEARAAVAECRRLSPHASLAVFKERLPYKDPAVSDRVFTALRKAGLE